MRIGHLACLFLVAGVFGFPQPQEEETLEEIVDEDADDVEEATEDNSMLNEGEDPFFGFQQELEDDIAEGFDHLGNSEDDIAEGFDHLGNPVTAPNEEIDEENAADEAGEDYSANDQPPEPEENAESTDIEGPESTDAEANDNEDNGTDSTNENGDDEGTDTVTEGDPNTENPDEAANGDEAGEDYSADDQPPEPEESADDQPTEPEENAESTDIEVPESTDAEANDNEATNPENIAASNQEFKIDIESGQEGSELIGNIITELASVNTFFQGLVGYWDKKVEESGVVSEQDIEDARSGKDAEYEAEYPEVTEVAEPEGDDAANVEVGAGKIGEENADDKEDEEGQDADAKGEEAGEVDAEDEEDGDAENEERESEEDLEAEEEDANGEGDVEEEDADAEKDTEDEEDGDAENEEEEGADYADAGEDLEAEEEDTDAEADEEEEEEEEPEDEAAEAEAEEGDAEAEDDEAEADHTEAAEQEETVAEDVAEEAVAEENENAEEEGGDEAVIEEGDEPEAARVMGQGWEMDSEEYFIPRHAPPKKNLVAPYYL